MQNKKYLLLIALIIIPVLIGITADIQPAKAAAVGNGSLPLPDEPAPHVISCSRGGGECPSGSYCDLSIGADPNSGLCVEGSKPLVPDCGSAGNPCGFDDFFVLLHNIAEFLIFALAPILVVLMISVGGFTIMASRGNPTQYAKGKDMIAWALGGYILILLAWVIVNTILTSIGVASWVGIGDWWDPTF